MTLTDFMALSYEKQTYYIAGVMSLAAFLATAERAGIPVRQFINLALPASDETSIQYIAKMKVLFEFGYAQFPAIKMLILRNIFNGGK